MLATNNTVQGGFANYHGAWETEVTDRGQNHIAEMQGRMGQTFDAICAKVGTTSQKNGSGSIQTEYYSDGSEVHTYYDENGDATAVAYRSADYAQHMASGGTLGNYVPVQNYAIVANAENGASGAGHNALLIGNEKDGYQFISKEGRNEKDGGSSNNGASGGPALPALDLRYKNFGAFIRDSKRSEYNRFVMIPINQDQVTPIVDRMRSEANSDYNLLLNNCGNAVENSLRPNGFSSLPSFTVPNNSFQYIKDNTSNLYYER